MKKGKTWMCLLIGAMFFLQVNTVSVHAKAAWPEAPEIEGETAIVMEASTGTVLYEKNAHAEHYPASITKIMTALLAIENSSLEEEVVFSHDAVYKIEGSHIARDVDEVMTMEHCLYALLLNSANECAYAIAEHVGGDYDTFIRMMNEKAAELGCQNTHFNNPHGLPDETHYTSAYDMALISREALKSDTFRQIVGTQRYTIPPTNKHPEETYLRNTHMMFSTYKGSEYLYDGCIGGKTGYTDAARNTLVTFAERNGMTLICVVLSESLRKQYLDTMALFDYCFENFQLWNVKENEKFYTLDVIKDELTEHDNAFLLLDQNGCIVLPKTAVFTDASAEVVEDIESTKKAGSIAYTYAGHSVGGTDIVIAGRKVPANLTKVTQVKEKAFNIKYILIGILIIIVLLGAGFLIYRFFTGEFYRTRYDIRDKKRNILKEIKKNRRKGRKRRDKVGTMRYSQTDNIFGGK